MTQNIQRLPIADTRRLLLRTGYDLLMSSSVNGDFDVKIKDVVDKANRTTGSAYQIWENQEHYRRDLAMFVAETVEYADPTPIGDVIAEGLTTSTTFQETITVVGEAYFNYFVERPEFPAFLRLASITRPDPELAEAVLRGYAKMQAMLADFLTFATLKTYDREMGDGWTIESAAATVTALTEGFALRARFAGNARPEDMADRISELRETYVSSLIALTLQVTRPAGT